MGFLANPNYYAGNSTGFSLLANGIFKDLGQSLPEASRAEGYAMLPWSQIIYYSNSVALLTLDAHVLNLFNSNFDSSENALRFHFGRPQLSLNRQWIAFVKYTTQELYNDKIRVLNSTLFVVDSHSGDLLWQVPGITQFEWVSDNQIFGTDMMAKVGDSSDFEHACPRAVTMSDPWKAHLLNIEAKSDLVLQSWPRLFDPCGDQQTEWMDLILNAVNKNLYVIHRSSSVGMIYQFDLGEQTLKPMTQISEKSEALEAPTFSAADEQGRIVLGSFFPIGLQWSIFDLNEKKWKNGQTLWQDPDQTYPVLNSNTVLNSHMTILGFPFEEQDLSKDCLVKEAHRFAGSLEAVTTQCGYTERITVWEAL